MAHIQITLLENKQARVNEGLEVAVNRQTAGYMVVEGEDNATEISVQYPPVYAGMRRYVYMQNAKGEYAEKEFDNIGSKKIFKLPASMTFAGITRLVFYAKGDSETTVWLPVEIPIAVTGVDYRKVAEASPDVLQEAISAAEQMREFLKKQGVKL